MLEALIPRASEADEARTFLLSHLYFPYWQAVRRVSHSTTPKDIVGKLNEVCATVGHAFPRTVFMYMSNSLQQEAYRRSGFPCPPEAAINIYNAFDAMTRCHIDQPALESFGFMLESKLRLPQWVADNEVLRTDTTKMNRCKECLDDLRRLHDQGQLAFTSVCTMHYAEADYFLALGRVQEAEKKLIEGITVADCNNLIRERRFADTRIQKLERVRRVAVCF